MHLHHPTFMHGHPGALQLQQQLPQPQFPDPLLHAVILSSLLAEM